MFYSIKNLINSFTYPLRNRIRFSRPIKSLPVEDKTGIFSGDEATIEEKNLIDRYNLADFKNNSSIILYKENLYIIKLLEDNLKDIVFNWDAEILNILDVGSKNFSYASGLYNFFSQFKTNHRRTIYLDGIEIDPYRIMINLHSRYDYAMAHIKNLDNTRYITKNFLQWQNNQYDIITWFLPFIIKKPLINWGLPLKYFKPEAMLKHAYNILKQEGIILIVNQSEIETEAQSKIIDNLGLNYTQIAEPYTNFFSPFRHSRYITIVKKV